jgi:hypothetical protein
MPSQRWQENKKTVAAPHPLMEQRDGTSTQKMLAKPMLFTALVTSAHRVYTHQ